MSNNFSFSFVVITWCIRLPKLMLVAFKRYEKLLSNSNTLELLSNFLKKLYFTKKYLLFSTVWQIFDINVYYGKKVWKAVVFQYKGYVEGSIFGFERCLKFFIFAIFWSFQVWHRKSLFILTSVRSTFTNEMQRKKIIYFSDDAFSQYKKCKKFFKLISQSWLRCWRQWHSFAIIRSKSPYDDVWDTLRRMTARASLQMPSFNQIITLLHLNCWVQQDMHCVKVFFFLPTDYKRK